MIKSEGNILTQHCFKSCPPGTSCRCRNQINNQKNVMTELERTQEELITLLKGQIVDLTMMSKIELGDDVIKEICRLQDKIKQLK